MREGKVRGGTVPGEGEERNNDERQETSETRISGCWGSREGIIGVSLRAGSGVQGECINTPAFPGETLLHSLIDSGALVGEGENEGQERKDYHTPYLLVRAQRTVPSQSNDFLKLTFHGALREWGDYECLIGASLGRVQMLGASLKVQTNG